MKSDFYVTLPSNSSVNYFPHNTQSSYRTKLISPLNLSGEWLVGLAEIFFPNNWHNVNDHNNDYTIFVESEKTIYTDSIKYEIKCKYKPSESISEFFHNINNIISEILSDQNKVRWSVNTEEESVTINLEKGFEIYISKEHASKLLYILNLAEEDIQIEKSTTMRYRPSTEERELQFTLLNKNPLSEIKHKIPLTPIKEFNERGGIFSVISRNIEWLGLEEYITLNYEASKNELEMRIVKNAALLITKGKADTLLEILNLNASMEVKNYYKFKINPHFIPKIGEFIELNIKEYPKITKKYKEEKKIFLNVGMYKSANALFREFQHIKLRQLPDLKIRLEVPDYHEVNFGNGLAQMLGFEERSFKNGIYTSKYPLELDGGITEIFVYTDIIESHHVGDTQVPLLRILPISNEQNNQVIKYFDKIVYFPLRKNYIDTIEIELKTSSGKNITFTGGKTSVLLSFCKKKTIN